MVTRDWLYEKDGTVGNKLELKQNKMEEIINVLAKRKAGKGKATSERAKNVQFKFNKKGKLTIKEKEEIRRTSTNILAVRPKRKGASRKICER